MAEPQQLPEGGIDPNVTIPKHIRDQAAAADAIHKQAYEAPAPPDAPAPDPVDPPAPAPSPAAPVAADVTPPADQSPPPADGDENSQSWKHKFLSMQGRWQASQRQLGEVTEINTQLAGELQATQQLLEQNRSGARTPTSNQLDKTGRQHEKLITPEDVETYGTEHIDMVQRAAREAVAPEMDALRGENAELKKRVITTGQRDVQAMLTRDIPNWVAINKSAEFKQWLSLRNIYTGQVRREMLNTAYQAANAAMVVQLFRDFLLEAKATGSTIPTSQRQQEPTASDPPAPTVQRQPAMQLDQLAAPGRARPAPGDSAVPAEKPFYTRAQISNNYALRRRGAFNGRETEWNTLEADMIAAGNEGRVRS